MLDARETRVKRQDSLIEKNKALVCFTMNIAGEYKYSPLIEKAFDEGVLRINELLIWNNISVEKFEKYIEKTGCEGYFLVNENPFEIKKILVQIEDSFCLGRLYDIDIIKDNKEKVSRADINEKPRNCIICSKQGAECARSRQHSAQELRQHTVNSICLFFNNQFADKVAQNAVKSLLYEVSVTPKPGLVDRDNNGSHTDMDFFTFINSSCSLFNYFKECALKGNDMYMDTPQQLFQKIRYNGRIAEREMLKATNGVNTHKGAIFSLGIICAAVGYSWANNFEKSIDNILDICADMAKLSILDFEKVKEAKTFGEKLYINNKMAGVRGQAAQGFTAVKQIAYPNLLKFIQDGHDTNTALLKTLVLLMQTVDDTNIIKRSDISTLEKVKIKAGEIVFFDNTNLIKELEGLNEKFVDINISPGGSADLLAITLMIYFTLDEKK